MMGFDECRHNHILGELPRETKIVRSHSWEGWVDMTHIIGFS